MTAGPTPFAQLPLGMRWRETSTFGTFVTGANALAVEQLRATGPAAARCLWLWGPPGCGRTHLLQAACAHAAAPGRHVAYFPLRQRADFSPGALEGCETFDLVCIDDVDEVAADEDWERALFNLYNDLQENGGRLCLSASRGPAAVGWSLADLRSRLASALALQLRPLDEADAVQALRLRARNRGLELPEETALFLLRRHPRDLGSLCRLLDTLDAASLAARRRLTIPFIKSVLSAQTTSGDRLDGE